MAKNRATPRTRTPKARTLVARGITKRCPVCGQRKIFENWFTIRDRCPRCEFRFERAEGQFIGAVGFNTIITFGLLLVLVVSVAIATAPDMPVGPLIGAGLAVAVFVPVILHPFSYTIWAAVDLMIWPLEENEAPALGIAP